MQSWQNPRLARFLVAAFAVVALTAAIACSGDDDDDDDASSPTQAPEATATEASSQAEPTTEPEPTDEPEAEPTAEDEPADDTTALSVSIQDGDLGSYLVGPEGKSLYVFTRDAPGVSNCIGDCLATWPPLLVTDGQSVESDAPGTFDSIETEAGLQVTYDGTPLYYFAADAAAGDTNGHLVGDVWFLARPDTASTAYVGVQDSHLVGPTGLALYLFANDSDGVSNCSGQCIANWPALTVPEGLDPSAASGVGGSLGVITRDDGTRQITYNGLPLYYYVGDSLPGDTNGDGVGGVWSLATPNTAGGVSNEGSY